MKTAAYTSIAILSGALIYPAYCEKVQFEQLPASAQSAIRAQVGSERIEDIDRETRGGKTIYEVAFKRNGQHTEIQVADPGPAPASAPVVAQALDSRKITYNELPANVRSAADSHLAGAEINDVDRQVRDGKVTYEIGYKRSGGAQQELVLSEHGNVISGNRSRFGARRPAAASPAVAAPSSKAIPYADVPASVRRIAESKLSKGGVSRVDRFVQNGDITYQIGFQREDGQYQRLTLSDEGQVLSDQMFANAASAAGAAGTFQSGTAESPVVSAVPASRQASEYSFVTAPVQLSNPETIERADLPAAVRRELRNQAQANAVQKATRGEWRGKTVYQVGFTGADNRPFDVQFDQTGQIVYDSRTAPAANAPGNILNNLGRAILDNQNK